MTDLSTAQGQDSSPRSLALTPRQRQILGLMCKGKANKEIAKELDISLGTVKQHIAALFKRMRVQNRSMAVAQGRDLLAQPPSPEDSAVVTGADWADDIMLVRRPCVVLAVRVSNTLSVDSRARILDLIKAFAAESKAFHLPGGEDVSTLLFGVRGPSVWDAVKALLVLQQVRDHVLEQELCPANAMAAALDGGMAVISIDARGRWSGDTVVTPVFAVTRRLLGKCPDGRLALGEAVPHLLESFHGLERKSLGNTFPLGELETLLTLDLKADRGADLYAPQARALEASSGQARQLVGPLGSGKTTLCRALATRARKQGRAVRYLRLMPASPTAGVWDAETGQPVSLEAAVQALVDSPSADPKLLVIDDIDLLEEEDARSALIMRLQPAVASGCLSILTMRDQLIADAESVTLDGIDAEGLERYFFSPVTHSGMRESQGRPRPSIQDRDALLKVTEGIPLFVSELAASPHSIITLPVLLAVVSELDRYPLDWRLLRVLAQSTTTLTPSAIENLTAMSAPDILRGVQAAVRSGVLHSDGADQPLRFAKPLTRRCIASVMI